MARTVPSWSWTTWAILASVPIVVELGRVVDVLLLGLALGDQRDRAAVGDGGVERVDALLAADLERHDHLREDDGLAEGDERQLARSADGRLVGGSGCSSTGVDGRLAIRGLLRCWCRRLGRRWRLGRWVGGRVVGRRLRRPRGCLVGGRRPFGVEGFEDAGAEALLEFEQDPDPGEVDAAVPGEVADPGIRRMSFSLYRRMLVGVRAGQSRPSSS